MSVSSASISVVGSGLAVSSSSSSSRQPKNPSQALVDGAMMHSSRSNSTSSGSVVTPKKKPRDLFGRMLVGMEEIGDINASAYVEGVAAADASGGSGSESFHRVSKSSNITSVKRRPLDTSSIKEEIFEADKSDKVTTMMTSIPPPLILKRPPFDDSPVSNTVQYIDNNHNGDANNGDTAAGTQVAESAALRSLSHSNQHHDAEPQRHLPTATMTTKEGWTLDGHTADAYRRPSAYSSGAAHTRPQADHGKDVDPRHSHSQHTTNSEHSFPPSRVVVHHKRGVGADEEVASSFTQSLAGGEDVNVVTPRKPPPPRLPYVKVNQQPATNAKTTLPYDPSVMHDRSEVMPVPAHTDEAELALTRRSIELYGLKDPPTPTPPQSQRQLQPPQPSHSRVSTTKSNPPQQQLNTSSLLSSFLRTTGIGAGDAEAIAAAYVSQTSHASFASTVTTSPFPSPHVTTGMSPNPSPHSRTTRSSKSDNPPRSFRPPPLSSYNNTSQQPPQDQQMQQNVPQRPASLQHTLEPQTPVARTPEAARADETTTQISPPAPNAEKSARHRVLSADVTSLEAEADGPSEEEEGAKNSVDRCNPSTSSFNRGSHSRPAAHSEESNFSPRQFPPSSLDSLPPWQLPGAFSGTDEDVAIDLARKEYAAAQQEEEDHLKRALAESAKASSHNRIAVDQLEAEGEGIEALLAEGGKVALKRQVTKPSGVVVFDDSRRTTTTAATTTGTQTNGSASDVIGGSGVDSGRYRSLEDDKESDASSIEDELFLALCRKEAQLRNVNFRVKTQEVDQAKAKAKAKSILDHEATLKKQKNDGAEEGVEGGKAKVARSPLEVDGRTAPGAGADGNNRRRSRMRPRFFFRRGRARASRTAGAAQPGSKSSASAVASIAMSEGVVEGVGEDEEFVEIGLDGGRIKLARHIGGRRPSPNNLPSVIHASEYPTPVHLSSRWKQSNGSQNIDDIDEFMAASASGSSAAVRSILVEDNTAGEDGLNYAVPVGITGRDQQGAKSKLSCAGTCTGGGQMRVCIVIVATIGIMLAVASFLIFFDPSDVGDDMEIPPREQESTGQPNPRPSLSPTASPAPTVDLSYLQNLFRPFSGKAVDTGGTPQHSAVHWLATQDEQRFPSSPDDTVLERYAAVVLYFATTASNASDGRTDATKTWLRPENWLNPDLVLCEWHEGVKCERVGGGEFVGSIDLSRTGLTGRLPPEISLFKHLHSLILDDNRIGGAIPSKIGELKSLAELQLEQNLFSGTLPERIGNLKGLIKLCLSRNELSGTLPHGLYELPYLKKLDISHNSFSGSLSEKIKDVSSLRTLNVDSNGMRGTIPDGMRFLRGLATVKLDNNRFSGQLPRFELFVLEEFTCSNNLLSGTLPFLGSGRRRLGENSSIFDLTAAELRKVDLSWNRFGGTMNDAFVNLLSLKHLDLSENKFTGTLAPTLSTMDSLEHFNASGNDFDGPPPSLSAPRLKYVDLANNKFSGLDLRDATTTLEYLDLSNNNLAGSVPSDLGSLPNLSFASLRNCRLKGEIPSTLQDLASLSVLDLSANIVNGSLPSELGRLQSIVELRLENNALSGTVPSSFGNMTNLRALYMRRNNIRGPIPSAVCDLRNLHTLQVDSSVACACCDSEER